MTLKTTAIPVNIALKANQVYTIYTFPDKRYRLKEQLAS